MKQSIEYQLPNHSKGSSNECCPGCKVKVTKRVSKQQERPRIHSCRECGQVFKIQAQKDKVVSAVPA